MSSPLPCGTPGRMSMSTTSASSLSAIERAAVAPTLPEPTTVTLRFIDAPRIAHPCLRPPLFCLCAALLARSAILPVRSRCYPCARLFHVRDDGVGELRRLQLRRALHLAREIVGHLLLRDRLFEP